MIWVMAVTLSSIITIGSRVYTSVVDVDINQSVHALADRCRIRQPLSNGYFDAKGNMDSFFDQIKSGDSVNVKLSYDGFDVWETNWFVRSIYPSIPMEIVCEDNTYHLRKVDINKEWETPVKLKEIINYLIIEVNKKQKTKLKVSENVPDFQFENYIIADIDAAAAIREMADEFQFWATWMGDELYVGGKYQINTSNQVRYEVGKNIKDYSRLKWRTKDDLKMRVQAIGIMDDGTKVIPDPVGDDSGALQTFIIRNVSDKVHLKERALDMLDGLSYDGFEGNFDTWLYPYIEPGYGAVLTDPFYEKKSGTYHVDDVRTTFGLSGAQRTVRIGKSLA